MSPQFGHGWLPARLPMKVAASVVVVASLVGAAEAASAAPAPFHASRICGTRGIVR